MDHYSQGDPYPEGPTDCMPGMLHGVKRRMGNLKGRLARLKTLEIAPELLLGWYSTYQGLRNRARLSQIHQLTCTSAAHPPHGAGANGGRPTSRNRFCVDSDFESQ